MTSKNATKLPIPKGATTTHVLRTPATEQRSAPTGQSRSASTERNEMNPRTTSGPDNVRGPADECKKPGPVVRGAAMVRATIADEHREMQVRAYKRIRPYLAGAMSRLRRAYPAFQTVVFNANKAKFSLIFGDGTQPHEAPKVFGGLTEACEDLARLPDIEWLTAADPLWQVRPGTPQPAAVVEQYCHVQDEDWHFWTRRALNDARYYMRQEIYSRTVYGSHRPGCGKRIVSEEGAVVDEWIEPVEPLILRVLRERGAPTSLDTLCDAMNALAMSAHPEFRDGYYLWDVLRACERLRAKGALRRVNPKASEGDARFVLTKNGVVSQ